jgi:Cys-tRNA(Pro)/Cys-tRNA(Cys) deacylase
VLVRAGVAFTVHPYAHDPGTTAYGEEAVAALGSDPRRVFKTLVVELQGGTAGGEPPNRQQTGSARPAATRARGGGIELVVAVVPVAQQLDLKALAVATGAKKAGLADPAVAARSSGYVVGGISPLGQRTPLRTVVDSSAQQFDTVLVSAGKRGLQLELSPADLVAVTSALVAPVAG